MDDTFVYCVPLPTGINEIVTPCADCGYTVYINKNLSDQKKKESYEHALRHIKNGDFDVDVLKDVNEIELDAHVL